MEGLILPPLLQVVFDRIASPILQKCSDIWGFKNDLKKLEQALLMAQAVLEDAEAQQGSSKAIRLWLSKLKTAAHNADDVLDRVVACIQMHKDNTSMTSAMKMLDVWIGEELINALHQLEETAVEGSNFHLKLSNDTILTQPDSRETGCFVSESKIYGRDEDKDNVVRLLLSKEASVSFISILGIGGLGKTTLAQLVYNDEVVTKHFNFKVWVFVSNNFDVKRIMKAIIESATKEKCESTFAMDVLQSKLWALLHKKKYLIVLDDVWTENDQHWEKLEPLFEGGLEGSKILITTWNEKVASIMSSPPFKYHLKGLAEDDCWKLFKNRAFPRGEDNEYPNLIPVGKMIIQKCGGLPLAAKQLGSAMRFKRDVREWLFVQNSELWNLDVGQTGILPALQLSYLHLPSHLKNCFAFCSIFPKRYEINKEKLIQMWMAEGLVQTNEASKTAEDVGEEYFQHLVYASFFEDAGDSDEDGTKVYRIHDIMHDLAKYVTREECEILAGKGVPSGSLKQTRHVYVICDFNRPRIPESLHESRNLRTLVAVGVDELSSLLLAKNFPFLRLLDLSASISHFEWTYGNLPCLRYLDLSYTNVVTLLNIERLPFLETLNLCHCYSLVELPFVRKMTSLRHLDITASEALTSMLPVATRGMYSGPSDNNSVEKIASMYLPTLSNQLQTLPTVVVENVLDLMFLGRLQLRGELNIIHLANVASSDDAKRAQLRSKHKLDSLGLYWGKRTVRTFYQGVVVQKTRSGRFAKEQQQHSSAPIQQQPDSPEGESPASTRPSQQHQPDAKESEEILCCLHPPQNLKMLVVQGYPGRRFPDWEIPNLVKVTLSECERCECLPALGKLLLLKCLYLHGFTTVRSIGREFYGADNERPFPSLADFVIEDFPNLEEWCGVDGGGAFPKLSKLVVKKCPKLTKMPKLLSLQNLELRVCSSSLFNSITTPPSLTTLVIEKVPELLFLPEQLLSNNPLLTCLEIISCPNLQFLPPHLGTLTGLKSLKIRWCSELCFLPQGLQNLKALESLEICDCHYITSMPEDGIGGLSSLTTLSIENCSGLTCLSRSFEHLTSLEHLTIMYCPNLASFPEDVHHLTALRSLTIINCPQILFLPDELQHVTTLQSLEISSCPGITVLPDWIANIGSLRSLIISDCGGLKQLPQGLKHLTALQHLSIQECPEIEERCNVKIGEDWPKIAHIPHKYIGLPTASQSSGASSSA